MVKMSKEIICGIYKITNIITNKVYIGSSKNIYSRWNKHIYDLKNNKHHSTHLQRSWNYYGNENFKFEIIEECTSDKLIEREQFYIDFYNSSDPNCGYNVSRLAGRITLTREQIDKTAKMLTEIFKGENAWCNIYSEEQIMSLIEDLKTGDYSYVQLSKMHNISYDIVASVASHSSWKYLTKDIVFPMPRISSRQNVKLNEDDVKEISNLILNGLSNKEISDIYDVAPKTISDIRNHKTWASITKGIDYPKNIRIYNKNKYIDKVIEIKRNNPKFSYNKIGDMLGISPSYVCALLHRQ